MSTTLITGGAGFIGANFVHYWRRNYPSEAVVVLDLLTYAGNLSSLVPVLDDTMCRFVQADINDALAVERIFETQDIERVVHFAAESHVDRSIAGPDIFLRTNVVGTHNLLNAARKHWLGGSKSARFRFHYISTDEVYGSLEADDPPFHETTPYAPNSPYAASKAAAEHMVRAYNKTYGLPTVSTNCSNNYGPFQYPEKLIPLMLINALEGRPLPIYGDGKNIRDWLYVEDHCRAIALVLEHGLDGRTYNVGGRNELTNLALVGSLCSLIDEAFARDGSLRARFPNAPAAHRSKTETLIQFVPDRPGHDRRYAIDDGRITDELGFAPRESWETGLARTVAWYLDNEPWWRPLMNKSFQDWINEQYETRTAQPPHAAGTAG